MVWISSPQSRKGSGVVALIIGIIILLFSPLITSLIGVFLSAMVFVISLIILGFGISMRASGFSLPMIVLGIAGSLLALSALLSPDLAVSVLGILLGIWMILLGIGQLIFASVFSADRLYYALIVLGGLFTVIVGLYLIFSPVDGMNIMILFLGCYLIVYGVLNLLRPQRSYPDYYINA